MNLVNNNNKKYELHEKGRKVSSDLIISLKDIKSTKNIYHLCVQYG